MHDDTPIGPDEITGNMEIGSFMGDDGRPKVLVTFAMDMRLFGRSEEFLNTVIEAACRAVDEGFRTVAMQVSELDESTQTD